MPMTQNEKDTLLEQAEQDQIYFGDKIEEILSTLGERIVATKP